MLKSYGRVNVPRDISAMVESLYTVSLLRFDESVNKDICGNEWSIIGTPSISNVNSKFDKALQLNGSSHLQMKNGITLGGQDFTIESWFCYTNPDSNTADCDSRVFSLKNSSTGYFVTFGKNNANRGGLRLRYKEMIGNIELNGVYNYVGKLLHVAVVYQHDNKTITSYLNGVKFRTGSATFTRRLYDIVTIGVNQADEPGHHHIGSIDEFRILDGMARWTSDFSPPEIPYSLSSDLYLGNIAVDPNKSYGHVHAPFGISKNSSFVVASLHFNGNIIDEGGNNWSTVGNPVINGESICVNNSNYIKSDSVLYLGGQDFTIDYKAKCTGVVTLLSLNGGNSLFQYYNAGFETWMQNTVSAANYTSNISFTLNEWHRITIVYSHSANKVYTFIDGQLKDTKSKTISREQIYPCIGKTVREGGSSAYISYLTIYDGIARWIEDFTP